jgi:CIC family chloride channel protein
MRRLADWLPPWARLPWPGRYISEWIRASQAGFVALALAVGVGAGAGAVLFRYLILWFTLLFTGYADFSGGGLRPHGFLPQFGSWFVLLAPVLGGLLYGPLIDRFAREARGHGVPEVMAAVYERGGRIRSRVAVIKSLASAICIGAGGSVGREGPIVQIGSALGSALGQMARLSESRLRLLVACGAAGGISATFNAPIAGVLFSLELILRDFEARAFGVVVLSSVLADIVGRVAFGDRAFLTLPAFQLTSLWEYLLYAGLGLVAGLAGVLFTRVLYGVEDLIDRVWKGPEWARPAVGGMVLGLLLLALPQLYGVGYPVLEEAVRGGFATWLLLALLGGKVLATSLTIGIGGSGGVFAPALFMGAMLGTAYGQAMHLAFPQVTGPAGAYGLVAMGAVFAGAARAPGTAALIIFELTDQYSIILPLLLAVAVATGVSNLLTKDTIYTLKLRRRGIDILRPGTAALLEDLTIADAMQPAPEALLDQLSLGEVIDRFQRVKRETSPVIDARGQYLGTVTSERVAEGLRAQGLAATVGRIELDTVAVRVNQPLEQALAAFARREAQELPVLDAEARTVVGWLTYRDVLRAYKQRLERDLAALDQRGAVTPEPPIARMRGYRVLDVAVVGSGRRYLRDFPWPASALVLSVHRADKSHEPTETTQLRAGDRLAVLVKDDEADAVERLFGGNGG